MAAPTQTEIATVMYLLKPSAIEDLATHQDQFEGSLTGTGSGPDGSGLFGQERAYILGNAVGHLMFLLTLVIGAALGIGAVIRSRLCRKASCG